VSEPHHRYPRPVGDLRQLLLEPASTDHPSTLTPSLTAPDGRWYPGQAPGCEPL